MEDGTDAFTDTVITRVAAVCGEKKKKKVILIWSLLILRFLWGILVGYVNLKHESDLSYKVRNP